MLKSRSPEDIKKLISAFLLLKDDFLKESGWSITLMPGRVNKLILDGVLNRGSAGDTRLSKIKQEFKEIEDIDLNNLGFKDWGLKINDLKIMATKYLEIYGENPLSQHQEKFLNMQFKKIEDKNTNEKSIA